MRRVSVPAALYGLIGGAGHYTTWDWAYYDTTDFIILFGSVRRDGKSLGQMAKEEVNPVAGMAAMEPSFFGRDSRG